MNYKEYHKELKKKVTIAETVRDNDRSYKTWEDVHSLKKEKLKAKDKLNGLDLLYGYNQQRDGWLPLEIYKKSMMIPFIGLQSKPF